MKDKRTVASITTSMRNALTKSGWREYGGEWVHNPDYDTQSRHQSAAAVKATETSGALDALDKVIAIFGLSESYPDIETVSNQLSYYDGYAMRPARELKTVDRGADKLLKDLNGAHVVAASNDALARIQAALKTVKR